MSQAELLGFSHGLSRSELPLVFSAWLGLIVVLVAPFAGLVALFAMPLACCRSGRKHAA